MDKVDKVLQQRQAVLKAKKEIKRRQKISKAQRGTKKKRKSKNKGKKRRVKKITTTQVKQPPIKLSDKDAKALLQVNITAKERRKKRRGGFAERQAREFERTGIADVGQLRQQRRIASEILGYQTRSNDPLTLRRGRGRYNVGAGQVSGINYDSQLGRAEEGGFTGLVAGAGVGQQVSGARQLGRGGRWYEDLRSDTNPKGPIKTTGTGGGPPPNLKDSGDIAVVDIKPRKPNMKSGGTQTLKGVKVATTQTTRERPPQPRPAPQRRIPRRTPPPQAPSTTDSDSSGPSQRGGGRIRAEVSDSSSGPSIRTIKPPVSPSLRSIEPPPSIASTSLSEVEREAFGRPLSRPSSATSVSTNLSEVEREAFGRPLSFASSRTSIPKSSSSRGILKPPNITGSIQEDISEYDITSEADSTDRDFAIRRYIEEAERFGAISPFTDDVSIITSTPSLQEGGGRTDDEIFDSFRQRKKDERPSGALELTDDPDADPPFRQSKLDDEPSDIVIPREPTPPAIPITRTIVPIEDVEISDDEDLEVMRLSESISPEPPRAPANTPITPDFIGEEFTRIGQLPSAPQTPELIGTARDLVSALPSAPNTPEFLGEGDFYPRNAGGQAISDRYDNAPQRNISRGRAVIPESSPVPPPVKFTDEPKKMGGGKMMKGGGISQRIKKPVARRIPIDEPEPEPEPLPQRPFGRITRDIGRPRTAPDEVRLRKDLEAIEENEKASLNVLNQLKAKGEINKKFPKNILNLSSDKQEDIMNRMLVVEDWIDNNLSERQSDIADEIRRNAQRIMEGRLAKRRIRSILQNREISGRPNFFEK